jgi:hypothetical protein
MMEYILKRPYFFSKTMKGYQAVRNQSERSSTEDSQTSDTGLLAKESGSPRYKSSFWKRHSLLLGTHAVAFVLYAIVLLMVAVAARSQALHGPQLIVCKASKFP